VAEIELQGLGDLLQTLQQLEQNVQRIENQALRAGAKIVQQEASRRAPRSRANKKHLADNIAISKIKSKGGVKHVEVGPTPGDNSEFFYGKFLEFGTSKMAARPFMGPTAVEKRKEVIDAMANVIKAGMKL